MPPKPFPLNCPPRISFPQALDTLLLLLICTKNNIFKVLSFFHISPSHTNNSREMGTKPPVFRKQNNIIFLILFMILFFCSIPDKASLCNSNQLLATPRGVLPHNSSSINVPSLEALNLDGYFSFDDTEFAAKDFGNRFHFPPLAILHPKSVSDISTTIKHIFQMGSATKLTVAAKGHSHSIHGQAQSHQGIVINMESLQGVENMRVQAGKLPYVDVSGGELWINILHETLKYGLAPKSWTDYLHLTVGGTLSNGGISGQAFKHGPQINNVYQLEVVTGKGEVVTCSEKQNTELFHGVLGGLGQFGIITRARISLEPAPKMVKWIRVLYSEFSKFCNDQEYLISSKNSFDYIEGLVIINRTGLLNTWRLSFRPKDPLLAREFISDGRTLYCLEIAKYYNPEESDIIHNKTESLLSELSYIPSTLFLTEVSYVEFLDRVHVSEKKLRAKGLWEIPHPWITLLVPKSKISEFAQEVFGKILTNNANGPILIYPVNKSKWNNINRTSLVTPEEDVFYQVAFLSSAVPCSTGKEGLEHILAQNQRIFDFCSKANLKVKQYLPHYNTQEEWQAHFGSKWEVLVQRKSTYDPLAILAPGQRLFKRKYPSHDTS